MNISRLSPSDISGAQRWNAFVQACPDATFFHRAEWQTIIQDVFRHPTHFLLAENRGEIEGILPLAHVKSLLFGNALVALPFAVYGGVAATTPDAAAALEAAAQDLARQLGVDHLEFRNLSPRHADWPTQDLYVTFRKAILPDVEANMLAIPRKQRAMVRKGINNGLLSQNDPTSDRFFALFADNVHRHGTPAHSRRFFELTLEAFGEQADILVVRDAQGVPVSGVLNLYHRDEVLPMHAGDDPRARELAANDFKYWELMRRSVERGYRVFNYGRSKCGTGPFDFKKNWGFEPTPLTYEYRLLRRTTVPQNNPLNPKYRLMIATWRRLPRWLVNAIGPYLVRGLG